MKKLRLLSILLALLLLPVFSVGSFAEEAVVFVADGGNDSAAGTVDAPVQTLQKAVEKLGAAGGTVVIMGVVTINTENSYMPESGPITLTSVYDGVDYRTRLFGSDMVGARLVMQLGKTATVGFQLRGDYTFDAVSLCIPDANNISPAIASSYHNFKVTENFRTLYEDLTGTVWFADNGQVAEDAAARSYPPMYFLGYNKDMSGGGETIAGEYTVDIAAGDWYSVRVGDRDLAVRNTLDCKVTVNITGGSYFYWTGKLENQISSNTAIQGVYQACTTANFRSTINMTGGTLYGSIAGFGSFGKISQGDCYQSGTVVLNILNGTLGRSYNNDCNYIVPAMYTGYVLGSYSLIYGETAAVFVNVDNSQLVFDPLPDLKICPADGLNVKVAVVSESSNILADSYSDIKYGPLTEADTNPAAITTPVVTDPPVTDTPPVETDPPAPDTTPVETDPPTPDTTPVETDPPAPDTTPMVTDPPATDTSPGTGGDSSETTQIVILCLIGAAAIAAIVAAVAIRKKKAS